MIGVEALLDTNAVIAWNAGDQDLARLLVDFGDAGIPLFVAGELHYGALNSSRRDRDDP